MTAPTRSRGGAALLRMVLALLVSISASATALAEAPVGSAARRLPSPSGDLVALLRPTDGGLQLVIADLATGWELPLPGRLPMAEVPRWSPRGGRLAVALRVGRRTDVYLLELDGPRRASPRLLRLTFDGGGAPRWIVGGKRLLYQANDGRGGTILLERDEEGRGPARPFWRDHERREPPPRGPIA